MSEGSNSSTMSIAEYVRKSRQLYPEHTLENGDRGWLPTFFSKELLTPQDGESHQATNLGTQIHPFDMTAVKQFQTSNEHHSTCIATKVAATVGLGFQRESDRRRVDARDGLGPEEMDTLLGRKDWEPTKADEVLDPLTMHSFQETINDACEDYHQLGNGSLEIVRRGDGDQITGIHFLPFQHTRIFVEDSFYNFHYEITSPEGTTKRFAIFGDRDRLIASRNAENRTDATGRHFELPENTDTISEVIHFRKPTSLNRWYGFPKWLSTTATIELVQMMTQYKFDFFLNRAVPEFMLFLLGAKLSEDDWKKVENALKANMGMGNSQKSMALNLTDKEMKIQLEKLIADSTKEDAWAKDNEAAALKIVTAHQVPPLLAGIQIPGKLGATNELPNALMAFQSLVIGQDQRIFERKLAATLGNPRLSGGLDIEPKDLVFRTILEEIDVDRADTISRMRTPMAQAQQEGRDIDDGLRD